MAASGPARAPRRSPPRRARAPGVGGAQAAQDARPLGHRGVRGVPRSLGDRREQRPPAAPGRRRTRGRAAAPSAGSPSATLIAGERPHREGQDEGREAEAEQDAVEAGRERDGHHAPPRLGHLPADLRHDPRAARLADRGGERDRGRRDRARAPPAPSALRRAARARRRSARRRRARRRRTSRRRRASSAAGRRSPRGASVSTIENPHGDHAPVTPGDERGGGEHRGQHGTFVWKYMTQKTRRPL